MAYKLKDCHTEEIELSNYSDGSPVLYVQQPLPRAHFNWVLSLYKLLQATLEIPITPFIIISQILSLITVILFSCHSNRDFPKTLTIYNENIQFPRFDDELVKLHRSNYDSLVKGQKQMVNLSSSTEFMPNTSYYTSYSALQEIKKLSIYIEIPQSATRSTIATLIDRTKTPESVLTLYGQYSKIQDETLLHILQNLQPIHRIDPAYRDRSDLSHFLSQFITLFIPKRSKTPNQELSIELQKLIFKHKSRPSTRYPIKSLDIDEYTFNGVYIFLESVLLTLLTVYCLFSDDLIYFWLVMMLSTLTITLDITVPTVRVRDDSGLKLLRFLIKNFHIDNVIVGVTQVKIDLNNDQMIHGLCTLLMIIFIILLQRRRLSQIPHKRVDI